MTNIYQPELGQMCFGQAPQCFECPDILEAVINMIRFEINRVVANRAQVDIDPGNNASEAFRCGSFGMWAYSWSEDEEQPCNFHHRQSGLKVSWYKYMGRGMSCNMDCSPDLAARVLRHCMAALDKVDEGAPFEQGCLGEVPYFDSVVAA